jgi:hypothetical protein
MKASSKLIITVDEERGNGPMTRTSLILDWSDILAEEVKRHGSFNNATEVADFVERAFLNLIDANPEDNDET